jgi:hypothetical protein
MRRFLIFLGVGVVIILILGWFTQLFLLKQTKSFSPEEETFFKQGDLNITVFYNRPFKKGRTIFGGLVPYDEVWRTGANEATTFETNKPLTIEGKKLRPGKYTLWTIPRKETWTVIFNSESGQWGINSKGEANRNPQLDVLRVDIPAVEQEQEFEQFTIEFDQSGEDIEMVLLWDKTLVAVPIELTGD